MKKIKAIPQKPLLWVLFCACVLMLLSSFRLGVFRASTAKRQVTFPVNTLIPDLVIIDVRVQDQTVILSLKNNSNKAITAVSLSSSGVNYRSELLDTDGVIPPGGLRTEQCGLPSLTSSEKGITILAVVYEDGTSSGDTRAASQIFDARAGMQAQLARILPLLNDLAATPKGAGLKQKRDTIKARVDQLPEEEEGRSYEFRVGLHNAKELAINKLKELQQVEEERGEDTARQVLLQISNTYEKRNRSFANSLRRVQ